MEIHSVYLSNSFSRVLSHVSRQYDGGNQGTINSRSERIIHSFPLSKVRFCDSPLFGGEKRNTDKCYIF